jgi:hypothetical protein
VSTRSPLFDLKLPTSLKGMGRTLTVELGGNLWLTMPHGLRGHLAILETLSATLDVGGVLE